MREEAGLIILDFLSDNVALAAPEVAAAVVAANRGQAASYGADPWTDELERAVIHLFAHSLQMFPVATGASANALSLACITEPGGRIFCHADAHIRTSEHGGPAWYADAEITGVAGAHGKVTVAALAAALAAAQPPPGSALSLTNATEAGTVYTGDELATLARIAKDAGMKVHLDGARIANAAAHLGAALADISWRCGIDALSFGATKNGGLAADAVIFFDPAAAECFLLARKRGGHVPSKMRFLSAQLLAYLADDGWRTRAARANEAAQALAQRLHAEVGVSAVRPIEANHVFVALPVGVIEALERVGYRFYRWPHFGADVIRLVTNWTTTTEEIERFVVAARHALTTAE